MMDIVGFIVCLAILAAEFVFVAIMFRITPKRRHPFRFLTPRRKP